MTNKAKMIELLSQPETSKLAVSVIAEKLSLKPQAIRVLNRKHEEFTSSKHEGILLIRLSGKELVENEFLEVELKDVTEGNPSDTITSEDKTPSTPLKSLIKVGDEITFLYDGEKYTRKVNYINANGAFTVAYKGTTLKVNPTTVI